MAVTLRAKWEAVCSISTGTIYNFDYTGGEQTFTAPCDGYYKLEVWGAQGGYGYYSPGGYKYGKYGGYSSGVILSSKSDKIFIYVGQKGQQYSGGYNGGGTGSYSRASEYSGGGGGATHIAKVSGLLKTLSSHASNGNILIVAGGAGGGSTCAGEETIIGYYSGTGGGYIGGVNYLSTATGGTQSSGGTFSDGFGSNGSFGQGGNGYIRGSGCESSGGGGGGYYGGASNNYSGSGGSGYIGSSNLISGGGITKHMTCYSCTTSSATATRTISNTNVSATPTADYSKTGNGYARITYLGAII